MRIALHAAAPERVTVLAALAAVLEAEAPGTRTPTHDASFPFLDGFPLPPHLSHDDGEKADLAR